MDLPFCLRARWIRKAPGNSTTRVEDLRNAAEAAKKTLGVKIKRC
jgi:hypothetical protein